MSPQLGYGDRFIEHYLLKLIYPDGLTREAQLELAAIVLAVNADSRLHIL